MGSRHLRADIPINLPDTFKEEARELRNKLLLYRFHRRGEVRLEPSLADSSLEPRLNQILLPLLSVIGDPDLRSGLIDVARSTQASIVAERGLLAEAQILEILAEQMVSTRRSVIPVADITNGLIERYDAEFERPITNRWVGGLLRKKLNLQTYKSHGVYVVPMTERPKIEVLCARYGVNFFMKLPPAAPSGDVGTSGTLTQ